MKDDLDIKVTFEMSKDEIIGLINECIVMQNWTSKDLEFGRDVEVFPEWKNHIESVVWDYRWAGWHVMHYIHGDREYLTFSNPYVKRFNQ